MKKIISILLFVVICTFGTISCSKDPATTTSTKPTLSLSKTTVKIGEPVYATSTGQSSGSTIQWSVSSNGKVWTSSNQDSATYLFTAAGTYTVEATYTLGSNTVVDSAGGVIIVSDSLFTDTTTMHCDVVVNNTLLPNEQVNLTPIDYSDTGLIFLAVTQNGYSYGPILDCGGNLPSVNGALECDFNSTLGFPCYNPSTPAPARGIVSFTSVTNGTYSLTFKLNGATYEGTVTATNESCTIVWDHNTGVTISPLTIPKQFH